MKRRKFLATAAAGTAGAAMAASFPTPGLAQGKRDLRMVMTWPKNSPALGTGAERLAKRIQELSDGKLAVKLYAGGELVPPFEVFDAVSSGAADCYHSASYYFQGKSKALNFFTTVPFGLTAPEMAAWLYVGGGQELWDELAAQFNLKPFPVGNTGVQMGGWFAKEINTLDDLKGLKYRMPGLGGEVFRRLGVAVSNLPPQEILPALQSGAIDGTEWVGPYIDLAFGFHKVVKYYYHPGIHEPGSNLDFSVNLDVWKSLTPTQQEIIRTATAAETQLMIAEFDARNSDALDTLVNKHGVMLRQFSDDIVKAIGTAAGQVMGEMAAADDITKRIYASFIDFRKKAMRWSRYGEKAFLDARLLPFKYGD
jgi:TRAP-type mannitol/chloroaromatic compound transport system substrate-binding protein